MSAPIFFPTKKIQFQCISFLGHIKEGTRFLQDGGEERVTTIRDNCVHWKEEALLALSWLNFGNKSYELQTQVGRVSDFPDIILLF